MFTPKAAIGQEISKEDPIFQLSPNNQPDQPIHAKITVIRGPQMGESFLIGSSVNLFGRHEGRILRDVLASRRHMLINRTGNDFILEDLQSTNGTYLNGNQVTQPIIMQHGDVIQVGETILVLEISGYKSAILGFGAKPTQMVDNSQDEVTDPTRLFDQYLADLRIQK